MEMLLYLLIWIGIYLVLYFLIASFIGGDFVEISDRNGVYFFHLILKISGSFLDVINCF